MGKFVVKTAAQERREDKAYRSEQDNLLTSIGLKREDFPCLDHVFFLDEVVLVVTRDSANIFDPVPPRNLLDARYIRDLDRFEYTFMPVRDEYVGEPVVETY